MSFGLLFQGVSYFGILAGTLYDVGFLALFFFYFYYFAYTISLGGVLIVYQVEIIPGDLLPVATSFLWILTLMISLFILSITKAVGLFAVLLFCGIFSTFIWVWFQRFCVETKGKTRLEIEGEFKLKSMISLKTASRVKSVPGKINSNL